MADLTIPCDCMVRQQDDGSIACRLCRGDFYACECPIRHTRACELATWEREHGAQFPPIDRQEELAAAIFGDLPTDDTDLTDWYAQTETTRDPSSSGGTRYRIDSFDWDVTELGIRAAVDLDRGRYAR